MPINRRDFINRSALTGAGVALAGTAGTVAAAPEAGAADTAGGNDCKPSTYAITILGTTDLHTHIFNWDYYTNAEYKDSKGDEVGIAKISTLVQQQREAKGRDR